MNVKDLVNKLGGASAVAARCGCVVSAVSNWRWTGIPYKYWSVVIAMAADAKEPFGVTADDLEGMRDSAIAADAARKAERSATESAAA